MRKVLGLMIKGLFRGGLPEDWVMSVAPYTVLKAMRLMRYLMQLLKVADIGAAKGILSGLRALLFVRLLHSIHLRGWSLCEAAAKVLSRPSGIAPHQGQLQSS